jgi:hypothetical protein
MHVDIRILDNLNTAAMWQGYQPGDRLRCVWELEAFLPGKNLKDEIKMLAEEMFRMFNQDNRPNGKFAKSMSVGDVVQINYGDGRVFLACDKLGFVEVDDPGDIPLNQDVPISNAIALGPVEHGVAIYYRDDDETVSRRR